MPPKKRSRKLSRKRSRKTSKKRSRKSTKQTQEICSPKKTIPMILSDIKVIDPKFVKGKLKKAELIQRCNALYKQKGSTLINNSGWEEFADKCINETTIFGDEWNEIDKKNRIKLENNSCYEIDELLNSLAMQVNTSKYGGPYPQFPKDIYSNKELTHNDLGMILYVASESKTKINGPLYMILIAFFNNKNAYNALMKKEYNKARDVFFKNDNENISSSEQLLNILLRIKYRFAISSEKDSQNNNKGIWLSKDTPLNEYEKFDLLESAYKNANLLGQHYSAVNDIRDFIDKYQVEHYGTIKLDSGGYKIKSPIIKYDITDDKYKMYVKE